METTQTTKMTTKTKQKKGEKSHLDLVLEELREFNETFGVFLSYGKYVGLKSHGWLDSYIEQIIKKNKWKDSRLPNSEELEKKRTNYMLKLRGKRKEYYEK